MSKERIEIKSLSSDVEKGWFIINNEIMIKYNEFGEDFETDGKISAEVQYNEEQYSVEQIQTLIFTLLDKIIQDYKSNSEQ